MNKTNAMRRLDTAKIPYEEIEYEVMEDVAGISVADKLKEDHRFVYKTLVTTDGKNYYVFVVCITHELDLKKAAKAVGAKKIEMIAMKDLKKVTGYIRGGCSPIGMKKKFLTTIDSDCLLLNHIFVSGGKIGTQIKIHPKDLIAVCNMQVTDIKK